ncbi:MAG: hypothetical protein HXS50_03510 [Theionarchaea archaeon]|nr:hypothetical protein [Theionarchaea archaeon]
MIFTFLLWSIPGCPALEDGRIGLLFIGDLSNAGAFWMTRSDPLFRSTFVPATMRDFMLFGPLPAPSVADLSRLIRLHMPRTYGVVVENYDVIIFFEANAHAVGFHIRKLANSVSEGGLGLLMEGGWQSYGGNAGYPGWDGTEIEPLLPTEIIPSGWHESVLHRLVIDMPEHEYMTSIPWEVDLLALRGTIWNHNLLKVRPGASQLARVVSPTCDSPMMVTWRLEGGSRTFSCASEWLWQFFVADWWRYQYDAASNLMIYLDDRPVPQDLALVEATRSKILEFATRRTLLISLLAFCESFGANTQDITNELVEVDQLAAQALPFYLEQRFEDALETYDEAVGMMQDLEGEVMKLKRRALLWVYIIEYLSITATALLSGVILWSLMVRRALYRQVRFTKFTSH